MILNDPKQQSLNNTTNTVISHQSMSIKNEFKRRVFNKILLPKFTNEESNRTSPSSINHHPSPHSHSTSKKESFLQKFTDKRIIDLLKETKNRFLSSNNHSQVTLESSIKPINLKVTNQQFSNKNEFEHQQKLTTSETPTQLAPSNILKPVALRPKKNDQKPLVYRLSSCDTNLPHSNLSSFIFGGNQNPNRQSKFIDQRTLTNRRAFVTRSTYINDENYDFTQENLARNSIIRSSMKLYDRDQENQKNESRPHLNLIKMKVQNLIETNVEKTTNSSNNETKRNEIYNNNNNNTNNNDDDDLNTNDIFQRINQLPKNKNKQQTSLLTLSSPSSSSLDSISSNDSSKDPLFKNYTKYFLKPNDDVNIDLEQIENDSN